MSVLHLLEGPPAEALIRNAQSYRYAINKPVILIAVAFASFCFAICGFLYLKTPLDEVQMILAFAAALVGGSYFSLRSIYWWSFVSERVVAISDNMFIVGKKDKVWGIDWSILDVDAMGIENMVLSKMGAHFVVKVAGEHIKVPLYGAMYYLEDLEKFMGDVLAHVHVEPNNEDDGEL